MRLATVAVNGVAPLRIWKNVSQMRMATIRFCCHLFRLHCRTRLVLRLVWAEHVGPWRPSCPLSLVLKAPGDPDHSVLSGNECRFTRDSKKPSKNQQTLGLHPRSDPACSLFMLWKVVTAQAHYSTTHASAPGRRSLVPARCQQDNAGLFSPVRHIGWGLCITAAVSLF